MHIPRIAVAAVTALALAACTTEGRQKELGGTLLGAGLGALAGSQVGSGKGQLVAVAIGALAGAWIGGEVGKSLDKADRLAAQQAAQTALESRADGQTTAWRNPNSGHSGTYTPTRTYVSANRQPCREYETTVVIDGREERAVGRACRQSDGTWKIVQ